MKIDGVSVRHLDVAAGDCAIEAVEGPVYAVLWWRNLPLGSVALAQGETPCPASRLRSLAAGFVADQVIARSRRFGPTPLATFDGVPSQAVTLEAARAAEGLIDQLEAIAARPLSPAEPLSVIICTRDRPDSLARCLASLSAQVRPPGEVLVVDNSATGSAQPVCAQHPGVRWLHEPRPGLSVARNAGVRAAQGELIAFTDDDVELHPDWAGAMAAAFEETRAEAVTGLVLPAVLDTAAQNAFEHQLGGFTRQFVPVLFDQGFFEQTRAMAAQVWRIGAGANMAFRRGVFDRVGLFDERLGAGASGCSEDSEFWYRILATGGACLYEPRAVVFHHHRAEWSELLAQVRAYMKGHVSALVVQADRFGHPANVRRIFTQLPDYFLMTALSAIKYTRPDRLAILGGEVRGWARGLRYLADLAWRRRTQRWRRGSHYHA